MRLSPANSCGWGISDFAQSLHATVDYGRSLLHLVSRAYEEKANTPLAGIKMYVAGLKRSDKLSIDYANGPRTGSISHGGFDNDPATLASIMTRIRGSAAPHPPTAAELVGY